MKETTKIQFVSTTESNLSILPQKDGQLIFVEDKKKIILDNHGVRTVYEQIQTLQTENQRIELLSPIDTFYFVIETSTLYRYSGEWKKLVTATPPRKSTLP